MGDLLSLLWIFILLQMFVPALQKRVLEAKRQFAMRRIEARRKSRVITMIHRQESMSLLGFPIARYIDIEDSERVLRAIRLTPPERPIDIVLHTPGGLVLAAEQIACALRRHPAKVTVFVPHYAMSGGTLIALAAGEIVMDPNAVLGSVDPQIGLPPGIMFPAASILAALQKENPNREDQTLILGDVAAKAVRQVYATVHGLLQGHLPDDRAQEVASKLSEGYWTHDYPICFDEARGLDLPVSDAMPKEIYELMDLYPQAGPRRPSVEFVPAPYRPPAPRPTGARPQGACQGGRRSWPSPGSYPGCGRAGGG